jgi:hypothetical protein
VSEGVSGRPAAALPGAGEYFVERLADLGRQVRGAVVAARAASAPMAGVTKVTAADTIYEIDAQVEPVIERFCEAWGREMPLVLVAEGISDERGIEGRAVFPRGAAEADALVRVLCDPIDGTRGLMYDKRAAWFLAGVAPNRGEHTRLRNIGAAVQVEIPTSKQGLADVLWAVRGGGARGRRERLDGMGGGAGAGEKLAIRPSQAESITHGFAGVSNFFPGTKALAAELMEAIAEALIGRENVGKGLVFDDQYISTGGQLYELIVGHDRFNADLRPLFYRVRGWPAGLCVHPYDLAGMLIAEEAGVLLTDGVGGVVDGPLDVESPLQWAGFANARLKAAIEPVMTAVLTRWLRDAGGVS